MLLAASLWVFWNKKGEDEVSRVRKREKYRMNIKGELFAQGKSGEKGIEVKLS